MGEDEEGRIEVEQRGHVLLMGIDRVEKRNGFTPRMFRDLGTAFTRLQDEPELLVGLLYAHGDHFSAGIDMMKMLPIRLNGEPFVPLHLVDPGNTREPFRTKPVVTALQGICFTIALELAMASDIVIAAEDCRFSQAEVRRGIIAGYGGSFRLIERAGWGNAMRWLLTGDEFDAREAYRIGLVQEIVPTGKPFERALEIANCIAKQAPLAVQSTIEAGRRAQGTDWIATAAFMGSRNTQLYRTEDAAEGRQSFIEKREAVFKGR
jgi:enoyl-CoA hydratase/carnithine racemase